MVDDRFELVSDGSALAVLSSAAVARALGLVHGGGPELVSSRSNMPVKDVVSTGSRSVSAPWRHPNADRP